MPLLQLTSNNDTFKLYAPDTQKRTPLFNGAEQGSDILKVKKYFQTIVMDDPKNCFIKFPSISALIRYFHTSSDDVYQALEELKQTGFDYKVLNDSTPIILWDTLAISND